MIGTCVLVHVASVKGQGYGETLILCPNLLLNCKQEPSAEKWLPLLVWALADVCLGFRLLNGKKKPGEKSELVTKSRICREWIQLLFWLLTCYMLNIENMGNYKEEKWPIVISSGSNYCYFGELLFFPTLCFMKVGMCHIPMVCPVFLCLVLVIGTFSCVLISSSTVFFMAAWYLIIWMYWNWLIPNWIIFKTFCFK